MTANELLEQLRSAAVGSALDWKQARDQITSEYGEASAPERETLLQIYMIVMDTAERGLSGLDLESFRTSREQDYNLMLIRECVDNGGIVRPDVLRVVTQREVAAGRMAQDSELRQLAVTGPEGLTPPSETSTRKRRFGFFKRNRQSA